MNRRWTQEEIYKIITNYPQMTAKNLKSFFPERTENALKTEINVLHKKGLLPLKPRGIIDEQKLINLWKSDKMIKEIAKELNVRESSVSYLGRRLNLPKKSSFHYRLMKEYEEKVLTFLKEKDGICELKEMFCHFTRLTIKRLIYKRKIFKITFNLSRSSGPCKRNILTEIFNKSYSLKTFICLDRTAVIRLMTKALIPPKNSQIQKITTSFLRKYLTEAEKIAVLWKLGVRKWSQVKSNIQIDGTIIPTKKFLLKKLGDNDKTHQNTIISP